MSSGVSVVDSDAPARTPMPETSLPAARSHDIESRQWLDDLSGTGSRQRDAIGRLHELLTRAARFEIARRRRDLGGSRPGELDDLATEAAADALMAIMRKLDTYRGASRFTTWAYKFALLEAAVKVRTRAWDQREVPLEDDGWGQFADPHATPDRDAETTELLVAVRRAITETLTPHQRAVLIAITLNDVPIDVLAERLSTTRGALYKTLHDARTKIRTRLTADGHDLDCRNGGTTR